MVQALTIVIIRLTAMMIFMGQFTLLWSFGWDSSGDNWNSISFYLMYVTFSIFLWMCSKPVANFILKDISSKSDEATVNADEIVLAGTFLLGFMMATDGVRDFISQLKHMDWNLYRSHLFDLAGSALVSIVIGLLIMVSAKKVLKLFLKLRRL